MLQQTQVKTVIPYYHNFLGRFPDLTALAQASLEEVLELWRGLGYYSRARRLWEGARFVLEKCEGRVPRDYLSLLKIPGVGEYTAGAIASFAFGECVPAVDGNVMRVVARFLAWEEAIEKVKTSRHFQEHLKGWQPAEFAGDFNQAMIELGATVCTPRSPRCEDCPLREGCRGFTLGTPLSYPVKRSKERITEAIRPTFVLIRQGEVLLKRRPPEGLLADLWEFPGEELLMDAQKVRGKSSAGLEKALRAEEGVSFYGNQGEDYRNQEEELGEKAKLNFPWFTLYQNQVSDRSYDAIVEERLKLEITVRGPLVHTFSHRRWKLFWVVLDLSEVECSVKRDSVKIADDSDDYRWVSKKELDKVALPVAFQKVWARVVEQ
jgi:A/G-specific adenine glycosylase